jgi:branched-chain amino acid transport system ATP-binding protein
MLSFTDVDVHIEGVHVLRAVRFALRPGSTTALVGRNGAGKTTTLRAVMGFVPLSAGRIEVAGDDLAGVPAHRRAGLGIGYAPEDRRLFAALDVEGNLTLAGQVQRLDAATLAARLEQVYDVLPELAQLRHRPAGSVSGGQGKMVALGRALVLGHQLVLLDEPFQGLAPALARRYADALRRLRERRRDVTLLVTESNPALLEGLADDVLTIERGAVAAGDSPAG